MVMTLKLNTAVIGLKMMSKEEEIKQKIYEIESHYPNLHIDLHRDQFKSGDVNKLYLLYNQLEEVKKYKAQDD